VGARARLSGFAVMIAVVVVTGLAPAAAAQTGGPPTGRILPPGGPPIRDSYIVLLENVGRGQVPEHAQRLGRIFGGRVRHVYQNALTGFSIELPEPAARLLAADPFVALVQQDGVVQATETQSNPPSWGLDRKSTRLNSSHNR
jgi:hypothetical protein